MDKIKIRLSEPVKRKTFNQLIKKKQEQISNAINKEKQKQMKKKELELELVRSAQKKTIKMKQKLQRSEELRNKNLKEKRQRCLTRDKYEQQKIKKYKIKEKKLLNENWKKSKKLRYQTSNFHETSTKSQIHHQKSQQQGKSQSLQALELPHIQKYQSQKKNDNNLKNVRDEMVQRKSVSTISKSERLDKSRLQNFMQKLKQHNKEYETGKIQQMGTKFQKIEKSRKKKIELHEQKLKKNREYEEYQKQKKQELKQKRRQKKRQLKQKERQKARSKTCLDLNNDYYQHSEHYHNWQQQNKAKQRQLLEQRLRQGTNYLNRMKQRFELKKIHKRIETQSIERKIYWERINKKQQV